MAIMQQSISRRSVLRSAGLAAVAACMPRQVFGLQPSTRTIVDEPGASILALENGVWAVVSKPLGGGSDTLSNGGVVVGRDRVLVFDGFARPAGSRWVVAQIEQRLGRRATDVVLSHHHGDHVGGLSGFAPDTGTPPRVWVTQAIKDRVQPGAQDAAADLLGAATIVSTTAPTTIDLGGRTVELTPTSGHTPSDIVGRVDGRFTFCGDLVWNDLFPNYMDAIPSELRQAVAVITGDGAQVHVPGHGPLPAAARLGQYRAVLDAVEEVGRASFAAGTAPAAAATDFTVPETAGGWTLFSPRYFETAIAAWHRELGA